MHRLQLRVVQAHPAPQRPAKVVALEARRQARLQRQRPVPPYPRAA
jgi:hypothetical protein